MMSSMTNAITSVSLGVSAWAEAAEQRIATAARKPWRADRRNGFMRCLLEVSRYYPPNFYPIVQVVQQEQGCGPLDHPFAGPPRPFLPRTEAAMSLEPTGWSCSCLLRVYDRLVIFA